LFSGRYRRPPVVCVAAGAMLVVQAGIYPGSVLELSSLDLEEIGNALADQTDYEHRWLINPQTGEVAFWTADSAYSYE
jgi:hypothetical protein